MDTTIDPVGHNVDTADVRMLLESALSATAGVDLGFHDDNGVAALFDQGTNGVAASTDEVIVDAPSTESDVDGVRERCELLGIAWSDEAVEADPEAVALIEADVAVRLRVVPLRIEGNRLVVAMVDPCVCGERLVVPCATSMLQYDLEMTVHAARHILVRFVILNG